MLKIITLIFISTNILLSAMLYSPRDIDFATLVPYRYDTNVKSLRVGFMFHNKKTDSIVELKNTKIFYDCTVYYSPSMDVKGKILNHKRGNVNRSFQTIYIDISDENYKHTRNSIVECTISVNRKQYFASTISHINSNAIPFPLKKLEEENPIVSEIYSTKEIVQQSVKETDEERLTRLKKKYKNSPKMEMDDILILGISKLSYFRGKKDKILIKSASGTFFFPTKKIKQAKFTNMPKKLKTTLNKLLKDEK